MKKFRILLALAMVVTMISTLAFAADESLDGYGISVPETVEYTAGAPVTFDFTMIKGLVAEYGQINFVYDTDVWTVSVDTTGLATDRGAGNMEILFETGGTYADAQVLATVTATLKDGATAAGSTFEVTKVDFWGDDDYIYCEGGYKTITVEAAKTTEYEEVTVDTAVAADTTPIVLGDDVTYTNVAKFVGRINLGTIKSGFTGEEALLSAGIKHNGAVKYTFPELNGNGEVVYSVLFWGITPEQAATVDIDTFYTAKLIKE